MKQPPTLIIILTIITLLTACRAATVAGSGKVETATPQATATPTNRVEKSTFTSPVLVATAVQQMTPTLVTNTPTTIAVQSLTTEQRTDNYIFSSPKLITETDKIIQIVQWMPDSDQDLLVRSHTLDQFTVEVFNIKTGDSNRLLETDSLVGSPVWLSDKQQIAYLSEATSSGNIDLFLINNDTRATERIASNTSPPLIPASDGISVFSVDTRLNRLQKIDQNTGLTQELALSEPLLIKSTGSFIRYQAAWNNNTDWIALYNLYDSSAGFHLVNSQTGENKLVDFGKSASGSDKLWASCATWSPDGAKLALIVGAGSNIPLLFTSLAILDPKTGDFQIIEDNLRYVTAVTWAPDSKHVLIEAEVNVVDGRSIIGLFLANIENQQIVSIPVLPDESSQLTYCDGLTWSPNGSSVVLTYFLPSKTRKGWYLIDVENP